MKMATLNFALKNNTNSYSAYAYVTGSALDSNNALFLLRSDGRTGYFPASPSSIMTNLSYDCAIHLGPPGNTIQITIPHLAGARLWFVRDNKLTFFLNPGGNGAALVEPSVSNPSDPNYNVNWAFCEFTWNSYQLYANLSYVDFVSIPIAMTLTNASGATQTVKGMPGNGLDLVCDALRAQNNQDNAGWDQLVIQNNGTNLRALSPNLGRVLKGWLFNNYYDGYVNNAWAYYDNSTNNKLTINTQAAAGDVTAKVSNGVMYFSIPGISYSKPSTADIFSNSSGPFAVSGNSTKDAITARLAAALNRSTLILNSSQPNGENVRNYYQSSPTNHYARICHAVSTDTRGYAFPYDDVAPNGGLDQSGSVYDSNPRLLTVAFGGGSTNAVKASSVEGGVAPPIPSKDSLLSTGNGAPPIPSKDSLLSTGNIAPPIPSKDSLLSTDNETVQEDPQVKDKRRISRFIHKMWK